jgi:hypothetical protein
LLEFGGRTVELAKDRVIYFELGTNRSVKASPGGFRSVENGADPISGPRHPRRTTKYGCVIRSGPEAGVQRGHSRGGLDLEVVRTGNCPPVHAAGISPRHDRSPPAIGVLCHRSA